MFRVVVFSDAPEVAVISSKWWRSAGDLPKEGGKPRGHVYWPPCKTSNAVMRLLKTHTEPNIHGENPWTRHPAMSYFATGKSFVKVVQFRFIKLKF